LRKAAGEAFDWQGDGHGFPIPRLAADVVVLAGMAVLFFLLIRLSHGLNAPFIRVSAPSSVSTDPARLPYLSAVANAPSCAPSSRRWRTATTATRELVLSEVAAALTPHLN
jgi:hypothetical protein